MHFAFSFCTKRFSKIYKTRLLGRLAPIFYFNCEHFIFVYTVKQNQKKFADFIKKISWIFKFNKNRICWWQIFEILIIHIPSLWSYEAPHKIWTGSVKPFGRLLDPHMTSKIYIYGDDQKTLE